MKVVESLDLRPSPFPQTIRGVGTMHSNAVGQEPMLRGMLGKCPLHINNLTSRGSILDVHYLHPKEFIKRYLAQKRPITHCCFGANMLRKRNHPCFKLYHPTHQAFILGLPLGQITSVLDETCTYSNSTLTLAFVEGVQRFDLRTSDISCRASPFTIPQWFLNGHVFHVAVIGSITVSASMDWDPSCVVKLALCLWCAGLTEC